jgi:hypothetical protein
MIADLQQHVAQPFILGSTKPVLKTVPRRSPLHTRHTINFTQNTLTHLHILGPPMREKHPELPTLIPTWEA